MENILRDLNNKEQALITKIKALKGSSEERSRFIKEMNMEDAYRVIHASYLAIGDMESLKRAIFIQWYAASEPAIYTGIGSLNRESEETAIQHLNVLVSKQALDEEFKLMVLWYHSVNDWYFSGFSEIEDLQQFLRENHSKFEIKDIPEMSGRGQMGEYWNSRTEVNKSE